MIKRLINYKKIEENKDLKDKINKLEKLIKILLDKKIIDKKDLEGK